jgi:hypothetical protein
VCGDAVEQAAGPAAVPETHRPAVTRLRGAAHRPCLHRRARGGGCGCGGHGSARAVHQQRPAGDRGRGREGSGAETRTLQQESAGRRGRHRLQQVQLQCPTTAATTHSQGRSHALLNRPVRKGLAHLRPSPSTRYR